jgi:hypothetical protein
MAPNRGKQGFGATKDWVGMAVAETRSCGSTGEVDDGVGRAEQCQRGFAVCHDNAAAGG